MFKAVLIIHLFIITNHVLVSAQTTQFNDLTNVLKNKIALFLFIVKNVFNIVQLVLLLTIISIVMINALQT